jgi:catechol 2,3-dioxygenase-like lactoylglutathione lyase family enzyme
MKIRRQARRELLTESKKHAAQQLLRQILLLGPIRVALLIALLQTPHRFRTKRQLWAYSGLALQTGVSGEYRFTGGQLQPAKRPSAPRGLNHNHSHDLKNVFKGAATQPETAHYYEDILGFREFWRGSADDKTASYSNLIVPEGRDYVEFILGERPTTPQRYGTVYHIALEVPDMDAAIAKLNANPARKDYKGEIVAKTGKNHKRQCNLFDPDGMRVELMEDHTVDGMPAPMTSLPMFTK